jgi:hypothetical protein
MFFTQTLSSLVVNAKLERPLDSHAPQTKQLYWYDDDDWGDAQKNEDYNSDQWEASDEAINDGKDEETYVGEEEADDTQLETEPQSQDEYDEDDQGNYL